ncbi:bifunctional indole-3-glycerol phosphate synthase/phosphoribosylanthranilate isomerase [Helicobacter bilis]|uniref:N-(5'-phosphoribosyl)anthranilate isomerase n=1 Tax=Helicobacter bilis TaxID=37372 RepID=A0A4U8U6I6_9HELI|nr:bifunctional indole-3-glycerol phosphate synthase/phosphoribosylanthranilate isomerase [Helicobacter bilis]TLE08798.1 bifunctional indole-3-glycerol phosphate synthase/phosphoribosylanthranilate isomerase [Helicobacter bilis]
MQPQIDGIEILTQICETKKRKMQEKGISLGYDLPQKREFPLICPTLLNDKFAPFVIAEVKRKSPTKGHISTITEPTKLAQIYINQGANAISVLCEEDYFQGSLRDLYAIKRAFPQACILRKDFILHKDEARVSYFFGADMVLLIVALFVDDMESFCAIYDELLAYNLTPLIEIHTLAEYNLIKDLNLQKAIVGINTRNLKTFQINKMEAMKLRAQIPKHIPVIFESGIQSEYDSFMAGSGGFQGILCGSFLVERLDKKEVFLESSRDLDLSYNVDSRPTSHANTTTNSSSCSVALVALADLEGRSYLSDMTIHHNSANRSNCIDKGANLENLDSKHTPHHSIIYGLKQAFSIGASKDIFATLLQRFYTKNHSMQKECYKPLIKVCGINDLEFLKESVKYADMLGFILTPKSMRYVERKFLQEAQKVYDTHKDSMPLRVGVVTHECVEVGVKYLEEGLIDCLQLHDMPISFCIESEIVKDIESFYGPYPLHTLYARLHTGLLPFYPSINYKELLHIDKGLQTHFALWDSSAGSGCDIDIVAIQDFLAKHKTLQGNLWLAGGISAKNLQTILTLNPMLLDICSGFESQKGKKSIPSLKEFFDLLDSLF